MNVEVIEYTDEPEKVICTAARNDYEDRFVGDMIFRQSMTDIDQADDVPDEVRKMYATDHGMSEEYKPVLQKKMWNLISERLLKHGHFGPFEHPHITFAVEGVSRSLMAQITRHRHVSFDIQSMRYVGFEDADPEPGEAVVKIPGLDDPGLTGRNAEFSEDHEDDSDEEILEQRRLSYARAIRTGFEEYQRLLDLGVPAQDARMVLPIGTKVNMVFTLNLRMLMHVADMRAAADAQWEIREMTEDVLELAKEWAPMTMQFYETEMKHRKNRLAP